MDNVIMVLEWVFQDILHFFGTLILLSAIGGVFTRNVYYSNTKDEED